MPFFKGKSMKKLLKFVAATLIFTFFSCTAGLDDSFQNKENDLMYGSVSIASSESMNRALDIKTLVFFFFLVTGAGIKEQDMSFVKDIFI